MQRLLTREKSNRNISHKEFMIEFWASIRKDARELKFDITFKKYLDDIENITGYKIGDTQRSYIEKAINTKSYQRLDGNKSAIHRKRFNGKKKQLIADWEENTHQEWPRYTQEVFNKRGKMIRRAGQAYDVHHIIENSWGGDLEWWNFTPASHPDQHQEGIHRKGGYAEKIFG